MICVDQLGKIFQWCRITMNLKNLGALGSVTKDFMEKTGRFILLDSDKCPKCASGKYEDIEVSLNFKVVLFIQTLKNISFSEVSKWPLAPTIFLGILPSNRIFTKYPNWSRRVKEKSDEVRTIFRYKNIDFLKTKNFIKGLIYYSHHTDEYGRYVKINMKRAEVDHVWHYSLLQDPNGKS